jgi:hypothetical protein
MPFISWVHQKTEVKKEEFLCDCVKVEFEASPMFAEQIKKKVEKLNGKYVQAIKPQ